MECQFNAKGMPFDNTVIRMSIECQWNVNEMSMQCQCNVNAMSMQCKCNKDRGARPEMNPVLLRPGPMNPMNLIDISFADK